MNKKQKDLIAISLFFWAFLSIMINWNDVAWVFNYRVGSSLVYDFFNPYQEVASANTVVASESTALEIKKEEKVYPYTQKANSIEIPAIEIVAPVVIGQSTDTKLLMKQLDQGTVYYPGSVEPGHDGEMVILGHSAPPGWPKIKYDWVFSHIDKLSQDDIIILNFNNREYTYKVKSKTIIKAGEDIKSTGFEQNNILTIVSCWPPGKDYKRIAVETQLVD